MHHISNMFPVLAAAGFILSIGWFAFLALAVVLMVRLIRGQKSRKENPQFYQSLAEALKAQRTAHSMTQEQIAEALGVSRQAVSKWETGAAEPSTSNLLALAKLYGVELGELLRGVQM